MNREQLFESMQHLDDGLLEKSEKKARPVWTRCAAAAACVCLVAAGAIAVVNAGKLSAQDTLNETPILDEMPLPAPDAIPDRGTPPVSVEVPASDAADVSPSGPASASDLDVDKPEPTPAPEDPAVNGPAVGEEGAEWVISGGIPALLSSYDAGGEAGSYAVPENGTVGYSVPLSGAMEEYGDGVWYHVVIDLFSDGVQLDPRGAEAEAERARLAALGYYPGLETYFDGGAVEQAWFILSTARYDDLKSFPANENYGYMLFLYNERVPDNRVRGDDSPDDAVAFNAINLPAGQPDPEIAQGSGIAAAEVIPFDEDMLSGCAAILEGTVTRMYLKEYAYDYADDKFGETELYHAAAKTAVYALNITKVWYGDGFKVGAEILIEDSLFACFSAGDLSVMAGRSYVLPIYEAGDTIYTLHDYVSGDVARESVYSNVYPYQPQITVTEDGDYIVPANWETLTAAGGRLITGRDDPYGGELLLVGGEDFSAGMQTLIRERLA